MAFVPAKWRFHCDKPTNAAAFANRVNAEEMTPPLLHPCSRSCTLELRRTLLREGRLAFGIISAVIARGNGCLGM